MLQDFYNVNRSWCYTNYGLMRQNNFTDRDDKGNNGSGFSSSAKYRGKTATSNNLTTSRQSANRQFEFSLMTYNCLSQDSINKHQEMYVNCPPGSLDWASRRERLARELKESSPDIVCLQEVDSVHHHQFYKPFLKSLGYSGLYKKRTGVTLDGCALFYKTSKFTLLDHIELEFYRRDLTSLLNRDNVALIGILKPLSSSNQHYLDSSRLIIATTHILFNPSRGDVKLAQLRLLLAELDKLISSFNQSEKAKTNVILCGDMNAIPYSPFYNFITTGCLDTSGYLSGDLSGQAEGRGIGRLFRPSDLDLNGINSSSQYITQPMESRRLKNQTRSSDEDNWRGGGSCSANDGDDDQERLRKSLQAKYKRKDFLKDSTSDSDERNGQSLTQIRHNFKFSSVYPVTDVNNSPFITTHHSLGSCMVDYIFYNRSDTLELLGYTRLLNSEQMSRIGMLPNRLVGSDHLSLQAKFLIKG